jgi:CxxC-x17-CxxC domain-containing protein
LNKQYTKEEYEALVPKIIEHMEKNQEWGNFFPKDLSTFAYNESAGQDFFPLEKEQAIKMGFKWRDEETKANKPATAEIPENIKDIPDTFTKEVLACNKCKSNYKIIEPELKFYKQMDLPIPRLCPECRYKERALTRNPFVLFKRKCSNCGTEIDSTFSPDRKEVVYCEKCYLEAVE